MYISSSNNSKNSKTSFEKQCSFLKSSDIYEHLGLQSSDELIINDETIEELSNSELFIHKQRVKMKKFISLSYEERVKKESEEEGANDGTKLFSFPYNLDSVFISDDDLARLDDGRFLNDNVIDFYLKYIHLDLTASNLQNQIYVFSSHFLTRYA